MSNENKMKGTSMSEGQKDLVTFFDSLGRTIIGERVGGGAAFISIKNPVVVNIVQQQVQDPVTGQPQNRMALQLLPLFFKEFLADADAGVVYNYNKANITMPADDIVFDFKLYIQYDNIFKEDVPVEAPPAAPPVQKDGGLVQDDDKVINLFDKQ